MFSFPTPSVYQSAKCFVTYGQMPYIQPGTTSDDTPQPAKGKPWAPILAQDFIHRIDLIVPEESYETLEKEVLGKLAPPPFFKITAPLVKLLDGAFLLDYLKNADALMLSKGQEPVDNLFTIRDGEFKVIPVQDSSDTLLGKLTMYLDRETYERAGLVGEPHGVKGKRGGKPRWVVQYDLLAPSMLHGKKGFDRLIYACKNAFSEPITWLCTTSKSKEMNSNYVKEYSPTKVVVQPTSSSTLPTSSPSFDGLLKDLAGCDKIEFEETAADFYEWLSLIRLDSPRVEFDDGIDPYLSRYQIPRCPEGPQTCKLRRVTWQGFMPSTWARTALAEILREVSFKSWLAFSTTTFSKGSMTSENAECTFFRPPNSGGQYILWEVRRDG
ncbi:hypothetical protein jhhlp_008445 [Lomentospora prolificans]|uniref:Uncharacterized protein n=1 Tax=Lomentospora prolificans TaxID=41688 RepID=A0A2N3MY23_9PEZI|nr:hypothetical protein jhhlp_008445 [Lomentospora prolificans]